MSLNPVPAEEIRAALRPYQIDATAFEAGVRDRIETRPATTEGDASQNLSSMQQLAAALLPWPVMVGGKVVGSGTKLSSLAFGPKILGYAALPAVSLFLMIGATLFSAKKIHSLQKDAENETADEDQMKTAVRQWWSGYRWPAWIVYAAVIILPMVGATWVLFLLLLASLGILLFLLAGLSKRGIYNRLNIAQACLPGLGLLGQAMVNPYSAKSDIHFVDQKLISVVCFSGILLLFPIIASEIKRLTKLRLASGVDVKNKRLRFVARYPLFWGAVSSMLIISGLVWFSSSIVWPATPAQIQQQVESFEKGRYPSIEWRDWEIIARWSVDTGQNPDLSVARQRLADEIAGEQNSFILGSAFRVGVVETDQIEKLKDLEREHLSLIPKQKSGLIHQITSVKQHVWGIYALEQSGRLTDNDRDFLEKRLLVTFDKLINRETGDVLEDALRVTQLLQVIHRPIDRDKYRPQVHVWLRDYHCTETGGFQMAGGFKQYASSSASSLEPTAYAVELMQTYGIPEGLDVNWVRSYLKPLRFRPSNDKWIAAVSLDRLNNLPGVTQPTWPQILYYERSLIAAILLVVLCLYATLSAPKATLDSLSSQYTETDDSDQNKNDQNSEPQINS